MTPVTDLPLSAAWLSLLAGTAFAAGLGAGALLARVRRRARRESSAEFAARERHLAASVLCSELAHELMLPLLFLRDLVTHAPLEAEDQALGREVLAKLETLLAQLRRTRSVEAPMLAVPLAPMVQRAAARLPELKARQLRLAIEVDPHLRLVACEQSLELLLVSLLRNAAAAASQGSTLGVRCQREGEGWRLDLEDDGPGILEAQWTTLQRPLGTLERGGTGLGLLIALRIARDHGWYLTCLREAGCMQLRVHMPPSPAVSGGWP